MPAKQDYLEPLHISMLKLEIKKVFLKAIQKNVEQQDDAQLSTNVLLDITNEARNDILDHINKMQVSAADKSEIKTAVNSIVDEIIDQVRLDLHDHKEEILSKIAHAHTTCDIEHKILVMQKEGTAFPNPRHMRMKIPESKL